MRVQWLGCSVLLISNQPNINFQPIFSENLTSLKGSYDKDHSGTGVFSVNFVKILRNLWWLLLSILCLHESLYI